MNPQTEPINLIPCPRCNTLNRSQNQHCAECGILMTAGPIRDSIHKIWSDMLFGLVDVNRASVEMYFTCLKLEPHPGNRILNGFLLAIAIPFILPILFSVLNRFTGIGVIFAVFLFSLISTIVSFYLVSILTYFFAKLFGGQEDFSIHSFLLSLIYAPLTLVSLFFTASLTVLFENTPSTCLNILNVVILVFTIIYVVQILRFGQGLSLGRSILATGLTAIVSLIIVIGVGIGLIMGGTNPF